MQVYYSVSPLGNGFISLWQMQHLDLPSNLCSVFSYGSTRLPRFFRWLFAQICAARALFAFGMDMCSMCNFSRICVKILKYMHSTIIVI